MLLSAVAATLPPAGIHLGVWSRRARGNFIDTNADPCHRPPLMWWISPPAHS
ncbi:hypothetical protein HLY00_2705 [Mycolicibacterium hippocampi]|uniref:Uncharacterized protein n=1 Tax=Mycolicibacterium hippocampi TaxID=659824 RepID=A0A850PPM7_9MYCO|nr:hypothetical protein [Mycolicibacterium hippocampi]